MAAPETFAPEILKTAEARKPGTQSLHGLGLACPPERAACARAALTAGAPSSRASESPVTAGPRESLHGRRPHQAAFSAVICHPDHGRPLCPCCCRHVWLPGSQGGRHLGGDGGRVGSRNRHGTVKKFTLMLTHHFSLYFRKKGLFWMK